VTALTGIPVELLATTSLYITGMSTKVAVMVATTTTTTTADHGAFLPEAAADVFIDLWGTPGSYAYSSGTTTAFTLDSTIAPTKGIVYGDVPIGNY